MSTPHALFSLQEEELARALNQPNGIQKPDIDKGVNGLIWNRLFSNGDPYEAIRWVRRDAKITKGDGKVVFEQKDIEVPEFWSQTAIDIVASKYFRGKLGSPEREVSVRQMINRVADTISGWGFKDGYFRTQQDYQNFKYDLKYLLINQYAAFNSPVWFNVGVYEKPQCSACFILAVEDTMESILEWYRDEGWIFKYGSGSGTNLSKLRGSMEALSRGGHSSGPVSFMKGADGISMAIRSGGTTRRAAKMVVLNVDHPDIEDFINCKRTIEEMARTLEASGVQNSIEGDLFSPYTLLPYQNANNSVRVSDEFMNAVEENAEWQLTARKNGEAIKKMPARELMNKIAEAAWHSADPGMQYDTTINRWHTCPNSGRINASNPCSEYMHLDNSACNLASINLLKLLDDKGDLDVQLYKKAIDTMITAQEIIVGNSSYPTPKITQNAMDFRELGLGYANLGALLMNLGLPYDSDEGRSISAALTSVLCGEAYHMSAKIAQIKGPFAGYYKNQEPMLSIIRKHGLAAENLAANFTASRGNYDGLVYEAVNVWKDAYTLGQRFGFRNSQATVLAPTGTIAFLMDCQTTGIEPDLATVKYKKLVGGGTLKLVNNQIPIALKRLGYSEQQIKDISAYVLEKETVEGAPHILAEHLPIFDCSFKSANGTRSISYMGHIKMMSAVQPFISGAISKTVNLPSDATIEDVYDVYLQAWKLGLKAVAIYRDGSKSVQPMSTSDKKADGKLVEHTAGYTRIKLPDERPSITHKFSIGNHEGYLHVGLYPETHKPGEVFVTIAKEGSTISGLFDVIATLVSMCLQSGIPLKTLVRKFKDMRFEPSGITASNDIPFAKSFIDYIFTYLGKRFLSQEEREAIFGPEHAMNGMSSLTEPITNGSATEGNGHDVSTGNAALEALVNIGMSKTITPVQLNAWDDDSKAANTDAPICECGTIMFRAGSCFSCPNCFATTGVCN